MKLNYKLTIASVSLLGFINCSAQQTHLLQKANWLMGTWESKTKQGSIFEVWMPYNETEYRGKSYMLNKNDTVVFEHIQLIEENNMLFYIPTVTKQNKGLPVRFALKSSADSILLFENATHDFPQLISYQKIGADSLYAEISGKSKGKPRNEKFRMKRVH
ncbi:MAG TPA: DUF6265 family protein [Bacteroidia bacterium]|nr:DUF6265 family protein [Bacteroidia bacterium]HRH09424.1 DUF6265 family protein [Bacteroidia bacterium]